jgi:FkbM family methyltransferase
MQRLFDIRSLTPVFLRRKLRVMRARFNIRSSGYFMYFNQRVYTSPKSVIFQRIMKTGTFEPEVLDAMISLTRKRTHIIDVGANIGVMSVAMLSTRSDINCISIECSPSTVPYLKKTHSNSKLTKRWSIVEEAISDKEGIVTFYTAGADRGAYDGLKNTGRGGAVDAVQVTTKTLDTIWNELGSPDVSLIKIDIEGGETSAIRGARQLIDQCRPAIIFEWNCENLAAHGVSHDKIFDLGLPDYELVALPSLVTVTPHTLNAHMRQVEMFAAIPTAIPNGSDVQPC